MNTINNLIKQLKENNEDFEFYPTTDKMIDVVVNSIKKERNYNVLDIGAGTCKLFYKLKELDCLNTYKIIEKSKILLEQAPEEAFIVGTDFKTTNLVDKFCSLIFCNPPYSEFKEWTRKILNEAFAEYVYLIIPTRWKEDEQIQDIIKNRNIEYEILEITDFLNAERQARAKVDIIKFSYGKNKYSYEIKDPFYYWFNNNFNFKKAEDGIESYERNQKRKEELNELITKKPIVETLVENYNIDLQKIFNNYKALFDIDPCVLAEIKVNKGQIQDTLKERYHSLKYLYWNILFNRFDKIKDRLTTPIRKKIFDILQKNTNIDFEEDNIYAIVMWIFKQSKRYENEQLITLFNKLSDKCNVIKYKSNKQTWGDEHWRWCHIGDYTHYKLDYRIIVENSTDYIDTINDIITIANCLGFYSTNQYVFKSMYNSYDNKGSRDDGAVKLNDGEILLDYKYYQNNNLHLKINKEFLKAFNISVAKAQGWIKNKQEAMQELDYTAEDVDKYYNKYQALEANNINTLLLTNEE